MGAWIVGIILAVVGAALGVGFAGEFGLGSAQGMLYGGAGGLAFGVLAGAAVSRS